jgi:hypothetical protein
LFFGADITDGTHGFLDALDIFFCCGVMPVFIEKGPGRQHDGFFFIL